MEEPFIIEDLIEAVTMLPRQYDMSVTGRRFNRVAGEIYEVQQEKAPCWYCKRSDPNPEFEFAEFGEVELRPKKEGKWRVQKITVLFSRIESP